MSKRPIDEEPPNPVGSPEHLASMSEEERAEWDELANQPIEQSEGF